MKKLSCIVALSLASLSCLVARAQSSSPSGSGIVGTATETVLVKAERLRLVMVIKAQGADPKSAVVALAEHKLRVQKELEVMKADKDSIEFTATRLGAGSAESAQMLQVQRQMQMSNSGVGTTKESTPAVHTAVCGLKAEWPLPTSEGDALALLPATLNEQIKARDLAGDNNKPKLSKAAQEQLEELEAMMSERYSYQSSNEPTSKILFVAAIPEEAKRKATAAAFAKANKDVDTLVESTGQKRGKLLSLTTDSPSSSNYAQMVRAYGDIYGQADNSGMSILSKFETGTLLSSPNADDLTLSITVSVSYAIE